MHSQEIEIKYLINSLPLSISNNIKAGIYERKLIEQGYMNTSPVVRVRRSNNSYYLTYKSAGFLTREEYNLPLDKDSYQHLLEKCDGTIITKCRYLIPYDKYTIELDIFDGKHKGLILAEIEFQNEQEAKSLEVPSWFSKDVTYSSDYQNSTLSMQQ